MRKSTKIILATASTVAGITFAQAPNISEVNSEQVVSELGIAGIIVVSFLFAIYMVMKMLTNSSLKKEELKLKYHRNNKEDEPHEGRRSYDLGVLSNKVNELNLELREHKEQNFRDFAKVEDSIKDMRSEIREDLKEIFNKLDNKS
jgi:hypothetical protein